MRKTYLMLFVLLTSMFASSCSNDDKETEPEVVVDLAKQVEGTYKGNLIVNLGGDTPMDPMIQKIILTKTSEGRVTLALYDFAFQGLSLGDIIIPDVPVKNENGNTTFSAKTTLTLMGMEGLEVEANGTVKDKNLKSAIVVKNVPVLNTVNVDFDGNKMAEDNESKEALITALEIKDELVNSISLDNTNHSIWITVNKDATDEQLKAITPTITLSPKATITPAGAWDLTKSFSIIVTAEDGIHSTTYEVNIQRSLFYAFEDWSIDAANKSPLIAGWATSNPGAVFLKSFAENPSNKPAYAFEYEGWVAEEAPGVNSSKGLRLTTVRSRLEDVPSMAPSVTSGGAFLGAFALNPFDQLASTRFGIPFTGKPTQVTGKYTYKAGEFFYDEKTNVVEGQKDKGSVVVVLFDVTDDEKAVLTGKDLATSDRIVAIGTMLFEDNGTFKDFTINLDYKKEYNPANKYKFTIAFSSSYLGDQYKGGGLSQLVVDDVEVFVE
ncbi:MAG: PCMD domain-containing protein [Marinifilaceae bacterium]